MATDASHYFDPYYFGWQAASAERSARVVAPRILERVTASSVVDVGCGTGPWLAVLLALGVDEVLGIDGPYVDQSQLRIPRGSFLARDLEEPLGLERRFDLAISLEVAHYLREERAAAFVQLLTELAPVVFFSAAIPHQPGGPARNRRWPEYWARLFAARGFRPWDWLRREIWNDERVDWWYAQNGVFFVGDSDATSADPDERPLLPLVHPKMLDEVVAAGARSGAVARLVDAARAPRRRA